MRRREVVAGVGAVLLGTRDADTRQNSLPVIGFLHSASPGPYKHVVSGFLAGLNDRGVMIGRDVTPRVPLGGGSLRTFADIGERTR